MVVNIINKKFFFAKSIWLFLGSVKHYWKILSTIEIEFSSNLGDPFEKFWLSYYQILWDFSIKWLKKIKLWKWLFSVNFAVSIEWKLFIVTILKMFSIYFALNEVLRPFVWIWFMSYYIFWYCWYCLSTWHVQVIPSRHKRCKLYALNNFWLFIFIW